MFHFTRQGHFTMHHFDNDLIKCIVNRTRESEHILKDFAHFRVRSGQRSGEKKKMKVTSRNTQVSFRKTIFSVLGDDEFKIFPSIFFLGISLKMHYLRNGTKARKSFWLTLAMSHKWGVLFSVDFVSTCLNCFDDIFQ